MHFILHILQLTMTHFRQLLPRCIIYFSAKFIAIPDQYSQEISIVTLTSPFRVAAAMLPSAKKSAGKAE